MIRREGKHGIFSRSSQRRTGGTWSHYTQGTVWPWDLLLDAQVLTLSKSSQDCLGTGVWVPYSIPNCFQLNRIFTFTSLSLQDPGLRRQHSENSSKNCKTIYKLQRKKCKYPYWVFVFLAVSRFDSLSLLNTGLYNSLYQQTLSKSMNKWNYCFAVYWTILKLSLLGTKS